MSIYYIFYIFIINIIYILYYLVGRMFTNGRGRLFESYQRLKKMVLDASLLNTAL